METAVRTLIEAEVSKLGISITDINLIQDGKDKILEIVIDKEGGIDIDHCVEVTNIINPIMDVSQLPEEIDYLEVVSKGVNTNE